MEQYTKTLENKSKLSPDEDNYKEELVKAVKLFRDFNEALNHFIINKGYTRDIDDIDMKISYINSKFKDAYVPLIPKRTLREWFIGHARMKKESAFLFCFAFKLSVDESNDFFRRICLQRGFDCHNIKEAVYYYALCNQLSYPQTKKILEKVPKIDESGKVNLKNPDILHTESIVKELHRFTSPDEVLKFLEDNISGFGYNNVTAYEDIQRKWNEIAGETGLALKERQELFHGKFNEMQKPPEKAQTAEAEKKHSNWNICLQILFGEYCDSGEFDKEKDRSLKSILKNNPLMHFLAEECFPDRQGLESILRGDHLSDERVRKILILLLFYEFWVKRAIKNRDGTYTKNLKDDERCISTINDYLKGAGYPELYYGNPFDWLFLHSMQDNYPLATFRDYMWELWCTKNEA